MTPISCTPAGDGWESVRRTYRRRATIRRAARIVFYAIALAVIFGATWYAMIVGAIYYL